MEQCFLLLTFVNITSPLTLSRTNLLEGCTAIFPDLISQHQRLSDTMLSSGIIERACHKCKCVVVFLSRYLFIPVAMSTWSILITVKKLGVNGQAISTWFCYCPSINSLVRRSKRVGAILGKRHPAELDLTCLLGTVYNQLIKHFSLFTVFHSLSRGNDGFCELQVRAICAYFSLIKWNASASLRYMIFFSSSFASIYNMPSYDQWLIPVLERREKIIRSETSFSPQTIKYS